MMIINEKETTPIKMDDKMLNGKFGNKQQDILESADRWFLGRI